MTIEAAAGKNPVSHVGKLYNLVAARIASAVIMEIGGVEYAVCVLVSQIGGPVDDPQVVDMQLGARGAPLSGALTAGVEDVVRSQLGQMHALREELLAERLTVY
jgi:S-adenosylmethionine synthetase